MVKIWFFLLILIKTLFELNYEISVGPLHGMVSGGYLEKKFSWDLSMGRVSGEKKIFLWDLSMGKKFSWDLSMEGYLEKNSRGTSPWEGYLEKNSHGTSPWEGVSGQKKNKKIEKNSCGTSPWDLSGEKKIKKLKKIPVGPLHGGVSEEKKIKKFQKKFLLGPLHGKKNKKIKKNFCGTSPWEGYLEKKK
jgi:hypothetical protein